MGIYDRDYYRAEEPSGFLSGKSMVVNVIIANCAMLVIDLIFDNQLDKWLGLPSDYLNKPWEIWRFVTYGFVHGGLWHLAMNMIGLWCFGPDVEDRYGRLEFLRIYLATIVFGGIVWLTCQRLGAPWAPGVVGASGGVVGIVILSILYDPRRELLLWGVARIPAWFLGGLIVVFDLIGTAQRDSIVANSVHLAGAAFAAAYFYLGWNLEYLVPSKLIKKLTAPRLRVHTPDTEDPRDLSTQVDEILDKINRHGEASLTKKERQTLEEASKRYQRRHN